MMFVPLTELMLLLLQPLEFTHKNSGHSTGGAVQCASLKYCQTEVESSAGGGLGG